LEKERPSPVFFERGSYIFYFAGQEAVGSAVRINEGDAVSGGIGTVRPPESGHDAVILGIDQLIVA
jgi:hypothetical protein